MKKSELMRTALASMASIGDVYTDAPECAASVAAAQNLSVLAGLLSSGTEVLAQGKLFADESIVCEVGIRVDGSLIVEIPADFDTSGRAWKLVMANGEAFSVAMFVGESSDDETWVVDEAQAFYGSILASAPDEEVGSESIVEYGVNEIMPGGAGHNPFETNFATQDLAEQAARDYLVDNPEVPEAVVFRLTIVDNTITEDVTLLRVDRSDLSNEVIQSAPRG